MITSNIYVDIVQSNDDILYFDGYIVQSNDKFDIICMDVFVDDEIPDRLFSIDFLELLKERLNPSGVLLYNCLARSKADIDLAQRFLYDEFVHVFPNGGYLDVKGNWMLVSNEELFSI